MRCEGSLRWGVVVNGVLSCRTCHARWVGRHGGQVPAHPRPGKVVDAELRQELIDFAFYVLAGEFGEGHEVSIVDEYIADRQRE